ncbi:RHS repeat domain-containing protein [Pseudomonas sp. TWP3-1]|uniref:RHS repeat domain-containing protein n=1 Tax=Pseudomonas sp. TWP3-1 TaxID=2804631 RepID=UPI003CEA14CA
MNTSVHVNTPSVNARDGRGLPVRHIEYLRSVAGGAVRPLITRLLHDTSGQLVAQRDPRLPRSNTTTVHTLNGQPLKTRSVDSGESTSLPGLAAERLQTWDAHATHRRMSYDNHLRVVAVEENRVPGIENFIYASATADAGHNRRGQLIEVMDSSGKVQITGFAMSGQARSETRTFHDGESFTSHQLFSPLGALLESTDAGGHRQQLIHDIAGQLVQVQLQLSGQAAQPILNDAQYSADGKITEQLAGNGVTSRWHYHAADGRLHRQIAQKAADPPLQDLEYTYDFVGNIQSIVDHTFTPKFFRNQRVAGQRTFVYDSLYRLSHASGSDENRKQEDNPGRPQPTDPNDRRNYVRTYTYDDGNNLIKFTHVRDGASHTREMLIDPDSNRGVRWKPGDPAPDFDTLFDPAGNLLVLQPGQPLQWNAQNQLASVTLAEHDTGPHDTEQYRYSQGVRVYKRHETHTSSLRHFHQARYLGNLEIRTKDNGEELHLITVNTGVSNVKCLHWVAGKPAGIDADQLRFSQTDHVGSCVLELDQLARMISQENYYPFGDTASMAARSLIEVDYKFERYSGKEMDVSGLCYYGARYYAPWLQRWASSDPAGDVDGLNRYAFVGNNPLRYVDSGGHSREESAIRQYSDFSSVVAGHSEHLLQQLHNISHRKNIKRNLAANLVVETGKGIAGYEAGVFGGGLVDMVIPSVQSFIPYATSGGLIGGNIGGDIAGAMIVPFTNEIASRTGAILGPQIPQTSAMSVSEINRGLGVTDPGKQRRTMRDFSDDMARQMPDFLMNRVMASWISIIPGALAMFARAVEAEDIKTGLDPVKIGKIETMLTDWQAAVENYSALANSAFDALGSDVLDPDGSASISRSGLQQQTRETLANIGRAKASIAAYKDASTTDARYLQQQRKPPQKHSRIYQYLTGTKRV